MKLGITDQVVDGLPTLHMGLPTYGSLYISSLTGVIIPEISPSECAYWTMKLCSITTPNSTKIILVVLTCNYLNVREYHIIYLSQETVVA